MENGYAIMVGGADAPVETVKPIFTSLKPVGEFGFVHAGGVGAGHFAKMVHNGIEYGLMQAYAEGYELLARSGLDIDAKVHIEHDVRRRDALPLGVLRVRPGEDRQVLRRRHRPRFLSELQQLPFGNDDCRQRRASEAVDGRYRLGWDRRRREPGGRHALPVSDRAR